MRLFIINFKGENKMKLEKIKIGGFRNIKETSVELGDITSLLSINSYGKSNFLNGIIFGIDFIHASSDIKTAIMNYNPHRPFNSEILNENFIFELELSTKIGKADCNVQYGYAFAWQKTEDTKGKIVNEYLRIKESGNQKYTSFITRKNDSGYYKPSKTGACDRKINISSNALIINKLLAFDNIYYHDLIKSINNVSVYVDRHFSTNDSYNMQTNKNSSAYGLIGEINVPKSLCKIKIDFPDKYQLIINTMKDIFPYIKDISCYEYNPNLKKIVNEGESYTLSDNFYILITKDKNLSAPIDFSSMSDGVKRALLIFTILVLADINGYSLVGIEEPENSLNPKVLQRYLIALKAFSKKTKVIITSHSPYLVNYISPKDIYIGLPNDSGLANFSRIKEKSVNKLVNDANNYDMLVGDYLFDLMSGDEEDLETITKYTE